MYIYIYAKEHPYTIVTTTRSPHQPSRPPSAEALELETPAAKVGPRRWKMDVFHTQKMASYGGFQLVMGGTPIYGWFRKEHPIYKWMMTGVTPISGNLHIWNSSEWLIFAIVSSGIPIEMHKN